MPSSLPSTDPERPDPTGRSTLPLAAVVLYAALLFLPGIGRVSLLDRDEPLFAEAARQMILRNDYLVPYFNGRPLFDKPPLAYWMTAGVYQLVGVSEWAARVGSVVAACLTCLLVSLLARDMFGPRVGLLAGLIMASNLHFLVIAKAATADSLLLLTFMLAFFGAWKMLQPRPRLYAPLLLYAGLALGVLCKGPVVPAVFLLTALGLAALRRDFSLLLRLHVLPASLFAAAVFALWLLPANRATDGAFLSQGLGYHVLQRAFTTPMQGHGGPFFYYVALLPASFFPWFFLLPLSLDRLWRRPATHLQRHFLLLWAAAPFLLFSFLKTKLPHYVLPAFPPLASIVALAASLSLRPWPPSPSSRTSPTHASRFSSPPPSS